MPFPYPTILTSNRTVSYRVAVASLDKDSTRQPEMGVPALQPVRFSLLPGRVRGS